MRTDRPESRAAAQSATWLVGGFASDPKIRNRTALIMLSVGVGLLWPTPLGGALLMVAASFALAVSWESGLVGAAAPAYAGPQTSPVRPDPSAPASY